MTPASIRPPWGRVLLDLLGLLAATAVLLPGLDCATRHAGGGRPDSRYATPRSTLDSYVRAVLAVDEAAELATATPELRARAERQRGPDLARRHELLKGKTALFRDAPIRVVREKVWGERAKILAIQGGAGGLEDYWVYSFQKIGAEWKISGMARTRDMGW
ncbi:MAG: hypothetical protein MUC63_00840 [Planctomycetes bacterium]|nr:hypothetical protein [Planctomycetota bacterium]